MSTNAENSIECRSAVARDFDEIARVWHESARLAGGAPRDMATVQQLRSRIDLEVAAGWNAIVATQDDAIIAFLAIKPETSILDQLFVLPAKQGKGTGLTLLQCAMRAMPRGFTLRTASANLQARRFYERAGLVLLEEGVHPRSGYPVCFYGWSAR
jgi:GNAT superfamily N-acetyltransferase